MRDDSMESLPDSSFHEETGGRNKAASKLRACRPVGSIFWSIDMNTQIPVACERNNLRYIKVAKYPPRAVQWPHART
jgi:hypothetical protein